MHSYIHTCIHVYMHTYIHTCIQCMHAHIGTIPEGNGGIPPQKFVWVEYSSFHPPPPPPQIYGYRKTQRRSRFCERPTKMFSENVQECDRELLGLYFYTVKRMCVYFPTQCFPIAGPI